jgi:hypothetical protein
MFPLGRVKENSYRDAYFLIQCLLFSLMICWRLRRISPVAEISLTQSDSSRILVCAGLLKVWRWGSLVSARRSIHRRREQPSPKK